MEKGVFLHSGKTECFTPRLAKISPEDLAKISLQWSDRSQMTINQKSPHVHFIPVS